MIEMHNLDPFTKFDDIITITKNYNPQIITKESNFIEIKIVSDFDEELWIQIETEFSIFFGNWHAHYFSYIEEYDAFIADLLGILENKKFIICAYKDNKWCASCLSESETPNEAKLKEKFGKDKMIKCIYWDSTNNVVFL